MKSKSLLTQLLSLDGRSKTQPIHENEMPHYKWETELDPNPSRNIIRREGEWEAIKQLRDRELENPAIFSNKAFINFNFINSDFEFPEDISMFSDTHSERFKMDVPVLQIAGGSPGHLSRLFNEGMNYRDVLFKGLHGLGMTFETLEFLLSDADKDQEMPHVRLKDYPETRSAGGISLVQYGNWFFTDNGHQRTSIAKYHIWQEGQRGNGDGKLKNVSVIKAKLK